MTIILHLGDARRHLDPVKAPMHFSHFSAVSTLALPIGDGLEMVSLSEGISQLTEACGLLTLHSHWV